MNLWDQLKKVLFFLTMTEEFNFIYLMFLSLAEKMDNVNSCAVILYLRLKGSIQGGLHGHVGNSRGGCPFVQHGEEMGC